MDIIDYLKGAGVIGIIVLIFIVILVLICAPIIVAILVANYFALTGISWWAVVIVVALFIAGLLSKLSS